MLRRSILAISSRRGVRRIPRPITSQHIPSFLRKEFSASTAAQKNASAAQPGGAGKPPPPAESGSSSAKVILGSAAVGAALVAAYKTGFLDPILGGKEQKDSVKLAGMGFENKDKEDAQRVEEETSKQGLAPEHSEEKIETHSDVPHVEVLSEKEGETPSQVEDKSVGDVASDKGLPEYSQNANFGIPSEGNVEVKSTEERTSGGVNEVVQTSPTFSQTSADQQESEMKALPPQQDVKKDKDALGNVEEPPRPLLNTYHLRDESTESTETNFNGHSKEEVVSKEEAFIDSMEGLNDAYISKDGKLILDFLQAIHAAEKRQADLDERVYSEEKRALKEKYEKELKDAAARELMLAEEAAMLDKELKRERAKAAAALRSLHEKLEEKFKTELEQKENEAELKLKKVEELAKAGLAAAIASEKTSQIEKMAEANLHINALCVAFYARSEEARQTHSAHKLALGALALEDALSKGLPIQTEIEALHTYLEGIDKDSILDLVLSSLPEETQRNGTDTLLQLNQKFDSLKGTVRHLSLIPLGGGGILAHSLAHIASWLKVKEVDQSGDGIESVISKVECYLADGKIAEAAEALEEGVRGTQATQIVGEWVKCARNRAITEQALTFLQSYATSISVT